MTQLAELIRSEARRTEDAMRAEVRAAKYELDNRLQRMEGMLIAVTKASLGTAAVKELVDTGKLASAEIPEGVKKAAARTR